jgi:hypothetical protein
MDDIVRAAMVKWPQVPNCFGWLGLDVRGDWYMRDAAAQAHGAFCSASRLAKGERLQHENLRAFIGRNYAADNMGRWFFQNGPQRVFVELEITPWIWRVAADFSLQTHTGLPACVQTSYLDEQGWLYLQTEHGLGLVHSQDMVLAAQAIEQGLWQPQPIQRQTLPQQFSFVPSPQTQG